MLQVDFQKLAIKHFLSVGEEEVVVDFTTGLNIITGRNYDKPDRTNGVGKSTIAEALHWTLFGSTIRELNKENIVNNITDGKCEGVVLFDVVFGTQKDSYRLERGINPSKCILYKNGIDITRSGISQTTELVCETIKSSPELFQNGVIMTINNTVPFMSQKKVEKRKFIESILNLGAFGDMLQAARKEYNEAKNQFDVESAKAAEVDRSAKAMQVQKDIFEAEKTKRLDGILTQIAAQEKDLTDLLPKLLEINAAEETTVMGNIKILKEKLPKIDQEIAEIQKLKYASEYNVKAYKAELVKLDVKKGTCNFCKKDIDGILADQNAQAKQKLTSDITTAEASIPQFITQITEKTEFKGKITTGITKLEKQLVDIKMRNKENENIQSKIDQIKKWIKLLKDQHAEASTSKNVSATELDSLLVRLKTITDAVIILKERLEIIESAKFVVSEEGVKSILIKKILKILNGKLAYYLRKMEANCIITFDEYFEESIINEKSKACSYHNFSGAERKSIDLACLFTFMDIRRLQGDLSINVSMYDELLDSSLDEKGVDLVLDILKERVDKYKEAVYIISHRRESVKHVTGDIVYLEKRNGISTRVPYNVTE